jgi:NAD(P)-dependent dehydrogenase (short-subunit alcohol dehydrogenase family)
LTEPACQAGVLSASCRHLLRALGFSEVLSREVAPLGIKVTIVEPGGFRTDFAGSSTKLSEGNPDYDSTVGATARFQRDYNGKQPGDPKKAAQAIVRLTQEQKPPLRL